MKVKLFFFIFRVKTMEIEFNGISEKTLEEICNSQGIKAEFLPLAKRDAICPREEGRTFGDGEAYVIAEESCWHGYYYCGHINCGRTHSGTSTHRVRSRTGRGAKKTGGSSRSSCYSSSDGDCCSGSSSSSTDCGDSGNDAFAAILIFLAIIAVIIIFIALAPYLFSAAVFILEFGLVVTIGLFDILTFGIFRKKFKRVLVYFHSPPSDAQLNKLIGDAAALGGLPRRYSYDYYTNGWWILRTGAYLFIPSLVAMILVFWLGTENGALFRIPIIAFLTSIVLVWSGNAIIQRKAREIASKY